MFAIAAEAEAMLASAQRQCLCEKWETRVSHFPFIWWTRPGWVRVPVSARISTCLDNSEFGLDIEDYLTVCFFFSQEYVSCPMS
ncbi:hypothetical protein BHE74_00003932 [Ensete ventricosum]|nr:hypothetical protein BHE74_00003932 [Ensete ventricosum]